MSCLSLSSSANYYDRLPDLTAQVLNKINVFLFTLINPEQGDWVPVAGFNLILWWLSFIHGQTCSLAFGTIITHHEFTGYCRTN